MIAKYIAGLNRRERLLGGTVLGIVLALVNLFLWSWLFDAIHRARADVSKRKLVRNEQLIYLRDSDLWAQRDKWLREHQPPFRDASDASVLLDQLKQIASKYNVLIENPAIGSGESNATHRSLFASIETKSAWPELVHFLYDVQNPDAFIVFENVNIMIDPSDPTQMRGKFRVARWYAPAGKSK